MAEDFSAAPLGQGGLDATLAELELFDDVTVDRLGAPYYWWTEMLKAVQEARGH